MAIYEAIPTIKLSKKNKLVTPSDRLPELVHLFDKAKSVFTDFSKIQAATISPHETIDTAIHKMKALSQAMLIVEEDEEVRGLISLEDVVSERPLRLMHEKNLRRSELSVAMFMKPQDEILAIEMATLKHAQVGHIINTIKEHATYYLLVVQQLKSGEHIIKGVFSASQIGKQLHADLSYILTRSPETIAELQKERKS